MRLKGKILFLVSNLQPGGMQMSLLYLVRAMDRTAFECRVWCLEDHDPAVLQKFREAGVDVTVWGMPSLTSARFLLSLGSMTARKRSFAPDIVCCYSFDAEIAGFLSKLISGGERLITTRRDMGDWGRTARHYRYRKWMNRAVTGIVANCRASREQFLHQEKLSPSKIAVIYNGVDFDPIPAEETALVREELNIPDDAPVAIMVANLTNPVKGHQELCDAAAGFLSRHRDCYLLLAGATDGNPAYSDALKMKSASDGIGDRVIFLGTRTDTGRLIAASDIGLNTSRSEGMSNAILEYMAYGKPVVATAVGGSPELVIHEKTGLVVPVGNRDALVNAVDRLIRNREERLAMGRAARKRYEEQFTARIMAGGYEAYFKRILGKDDMKGTA